jgi:hypothetical protein
MLGAVEETPIESGDVCRSCRGVWHGGDQRKWARTGGRRVPAKRRPRQIPGRCVRACLNVHDSGPGRCPGTGYTKPRRDVARREAGCRAGASEILYCMTRTAPHSCAILCSPGTLSTRPVGRALTRGGARRSHR